jgi:hypothetical protein
MMCFVISRNKMPTFRETVNFITCSFLNCMMFALLSMSAKLLAAYSYMHDVTFISAQLHDICLPA